MGRSALYAAAAIVAAAVSFAAAAGRPDGAGRSAALDGAALFQVKGCATCHDGPDGSSLTDAGPPFVAAFSWADDRIEGTTGPEYLEQSMRNPSAFISPAYWSIGGPADGMPLLQLSDDEIDALVDYLLAR